MPSILGPRSPYLKSRTRQRSTLRRHRRLDAQTSQTPAYEASREIQKRLYPRLAIGVSSQRRVACLRDERSLHCGVVFLRVKRHAAEGLERVVGEDVDAAMVGFEVVDLLAEEQHPEVFAEKLDAVERGCGTRRIAREATERVRLGVWRSY